MPRVSVIIPIFNAEPFLAECLQSVVSQTFRDLEIICVNDGSTDGSSEILRQFAARDERIRVIDGENGGCSAARNSGFSVAAGAYVLFLDADDYFEPTMIEEVYSRCIEHDADICIFRFRVFHPDTGMLEDSDWSLQMELVPECIPFAPNEMAGHLFRFVTPVVWNKMMRRAYLEAADLKFSPELKRAEDVPFTFMALALAKRITVLDRVLVNYRMQGEHSLHATIHTAPLDILTALLKVKQGAIAANVFAAIERDFVNAALEQTLYNLDVLSTPESAHTLFERLKGGALDELGITEHDSEYFFDQRRYEQYSTIVRQSWADYLFSHARLLRVDLTEGGHWARDLGRWLDSCRADLEHEARSSAHLQEALAQEARSNAHLQENLEHATGSNLQLQEEVDQVRARILAEVWELRDRVGTTQESLAEVKGAHKDAKKKLKRLKESRSYRLGRALTAVPLRMKRMIASPRKLD